jgi:predicted nucleic acid-binding protein
LILIASLLFQPVEVDHLLQDVLTNWQISGFISALLNQDTIVIENDQQIEQALKWYDLGADFSDALHLAVCDSAPLYTFDKDFYTIQIIH